MINLASLMGKITGKSAPGQAQAGDATRAVGEAGGDFAALVELAAQASAGRDQGGLKLVMNNGVLPAGKALPGTGEMAVPGAGEAGLPGAGEAQLPETGVTGLPGASQMGMPGTGGKALPTAGGAFPFEPANGLSGSTMPTEAQPSLGAPVVTAQKIAKAPTQVDVTALSAVGMTPIDPVVTVIGEDGQSMDKEGQPETSAQAQSVEQITGQIDPSAASMQASQAALAQMAVMQTPPNPGATSTPMTGQLPTESGQPLSTIASSLPVQVATASGEKPKAEAKASRDAFTFAAAETIGAGDSEAATTALDSALSTPTDSPRTRTSDASPIATAATSMISPLRAIVDSLPPVIQSTLAAAPVSAVTGPSTGEMLGDQVIDMGVSGQWIDRMAREITALSESSGHSRFTLNPPHLGRLEVNLWQGQDGTSLRLTAETDEAARRLSEGRPALQADARMAALNLGTITIEKAAPSHESGRDQAQRQGGDQASQMQQQSGGQGQGPGNNQTRAGNGQQQGEWVNRFVRDEPAQSGDAAALTPAQRAARGNVRFA